MRLRFLIPESSPHRAARLRAPIVIIAAAMVTLAAGVTAACSSQQHRSDETATVLVWVAGGISGQLANSIGEVKGVTRTSEVLGGTLEMVSSTDPAGTIVTQTVDRRTIPLDTLSYDPATFGSFTDTRTAKALASLKPDEAVLGATSARLRGIGVGGSIRLESGQTLVVRAVLDDRPIAGAELVVAPSTAHELNIDSPRFVVAHFAGRADEAVAGIAGSVPPEEPLRVVDAGERTWVRDGDQVVPQSIIKERFGEFSARPGNDDRVSVDPAWVDANIVTETVPLLGSVTCHRLVIEPLRRALGKLEAQGHGDTVDRSGYAGCFYPRQIDGLSKLSRHSWGIALDLNIVADKRGRDTEFAPELIEAMDRAGFRNGADWPLPDPAHFEWHNDTIEPTRG